MLPTLQAEVVRLQAIVGMYHTLTGLEVTSVTSHSVHGSTFCIRAEGRSVTDAAVAPTFTLGPCVDAPDELEYTPQSGCETLPDFLQVRSCRGGACTGAHATWAPTQSYSHNFAHSCTHNCAHGHTCTLVRVFACAPSCIHTLTQRYRWWTHAHAVMATVPRAVLFLWSHTPLAQMAAQTLRNRFADWRACMCCFLLIAL